MGRIRRIQEEDVSDVVRLYRMVYGDHFPFREFYDEEWVREGVNSDDIIWYVAESPGNQIVGSAAVMLCPGRHAGRIAEFGRLVVHSEARGQGIGTELCRRLIEYAHQEIVFGLAECRTAHIGAQKVFSALGFVPVGIEPLAYRLFDRRESIAIFCRLFGSAHRLRRKNPRVIPEAQKIGSIALSNLQLENDILIERGSEPYLVRQQPVTNLVPLKDDAMCQLLRLSRVINWEPEVFGEFRLEHGFMRIKANVRDCYVLQQGGRVVGGVGLTWDEVDSKMCIFDLVAETPDKFGDLLGSVLEHIFQKYACEYAQIDVSAYSPRMQRTLWGLGFVPIAYFPSMVYYGGERLDVIRMVKLGVPPRLDETEVLESVTGPLTEVRKMLEKQSKEAGRPLVGH